MLRIPAAQIMLPVIAQLICDRINVNATFVFSQTTYEQVGDAYLRGLESLIQQEESVSEIACFTSFSIGRLDAVIHPLLEKIKIGGECFSLTPVQTFCSFETALLQKRFAAQATQLLLDNLVDTQRQNR